MPRAGDVATPVPGTVGVGVTSAVALPALYTMRAAPGGLLQNFHFMCGRMRGKKFAVVCDPRQFIALDIVQRISQGHIAVRVVVSVGFAVGGDMNQLDRISLRIKSPS